jgi:hypothetical protein
MVLDATGASGNLKPGHEGPQRKRPRLADRNVGGRSSEKRVDEEVGCEVGDKPSKRADDAEPMPSEELHNSSSASALPSNTAARCYRIILARHCLRYTD